MPATTLTLAIQAVLGDAQAHNPLALSAAYSSSGSVGLYMDKMGQLSVVGGWLRQNAAAKTTDTGASTAIARALYMFRKFAAGTFTRQLIAYLDDGVNEAELHYSTDLGATWTLMQDLGAGSIGAIPCFDVFGDELIITNGVVAPRIWTGAAISTAGATQLAAPTLADTGAGPLNGSGYKYRLVPIKANKVRKPGSIASASLDVQNRTITVSWTADADGDVIGYELYRTTGSGLDYYLVHYIDGRTTVTYADSLSDKDLITRQVLAVVASHGDPPPSTSDFVVVHKGRAWYGLKARTWYWSDPGDPDSVYQDRSYLQLTDAQSLGDVSTGGTGEFNGQLVLWCRNSVWTVSGTGQVIEGITDWRKKRQNPKTGTVSWRTVVRVPAGAIYTDAQGEVRRTAAAMLGFLTPQKDIRLFDGKDDVVISFPKTDTLARINTAADHKSFGYDDAAHGMFVWVIPSDNATEPDRSIGWNYNFGTWHEWSGTSFAHVALAESSSEQSVLIAAEAAIATGAFFYRLWSGNTKDGSSVTATYLSKPIYPPIEQDGAPDYTQEKRIESVAVMFPKDASPTSIVVGFLPVDAADGDTPEIERTVDGSSRVRVPARQTGAGTNPGRYYHGCGFRFKLTSTATSGPWTLQGLQFIVQVLTGKTR